MAHLEIESSEVAQADKKDRINARRRALRFLKKTKNDINITNGEVNPNSQIFEPNSGEMIDPEAIRHMAELIVSQALDLKPRKPRKSKKTKEHLLILTHSSGWQLTSMIAQMARDRGVEVRIRYNDPELNQVVLDGVSTGNFSAPLSAARDQDGNRIPLPAHYSDTIGGELDIFLQHGLHDDTLEMKAWADKTLTIRNKQKTGEEFNIHPVVNQISDDVFQKARKLDDLPWSLTYWPNHEEARHMQMSFVDYATFFYLCADRDWQAVKEAQDHLISLFTNKKTVRVTAGSIPGYPPGWETDVTMSIEGMIPKNSTIDNNVPGSEIFTAPKAGSLEGTYAVPYALMFVERVIPNIKLVFKEGKVVEFDIFYPPEQQAQKDDDMAYVKEILAKEGASVVGELGIGTNPIITKKLQSLAQEAMSKMNKDSDAEITLPAIVNTIAVEKMSGSVHFAVGNSYTNKDGAKTDNGNRSAIHCDMTRALTPEYGGGRIEVDGEVIQENGFFLDPKLSVLNNV